MTFSPADGKPMEADSVGRVWRSWPLVVAVVLLTFAGTAAGAAIGLRSHDEFEIRQSVQVDHVLGFPPWAANSQTARFGQALRRGDVRERAARETGLSESTFSRVSVDRAEDATVVEVTLVASDRDVGRNAVDGLVDAALTILIEADAIPEQQIVDALGPRMVEVEATLETIFTDAEVAPGTDLGDLYNDLKGDLTVAESWIETSTDEGRIERLTGEIAAYSAQVQAIEPVLADWYAADSEQDELANALTPARERLAELEIGRSILEADDYLNDPAVTKVSRLTTVGRYVAGGAAVGLMVGLLLVAGSGLRRMKADATVPPP